MKRASGCRQSNSQKTDIESAINIPPIALLSHTMMRSARFSYLAVISVRDLVSPTSHAQLQHEPLRESLSVTTVTWLCGVYHDRHRRVVPCVYPGFAGEKYDVVSAAAKSDGLHLLVSVAMREAGIDISSEVSASIAETLK